MPWVATTAEDVAVILGRGELLKSDAGRFTSPTVGISNATKIWK